MPEYAPTLRVSVSECITQLMMCSGEAMGTENWFQIVQSTRGVQLNTLNHTLIVPTCFSDDGSMQKYDVCLCCWSLTTRRRHGGEEGMVQSVASGDEGAAAKSVK